MASNRRAEASETNRLTEDQIFSLLSNRRRRDLLRFVESVGGESAVPAITDHLAQSEYGGADVSASQRKNVYVSLHQTHLPKLADAGVVEYDEQTKRVALTDRAVLLLAYCHFDPSSRGGLLSRLFPNGR
ncbi:DUF7344 domain-containing protein [Haloarcula salina]|uniref:DUF7344 domain-containing protein n=1 Tax=Haloarcula salina TaxID=1429914 RepID=A0AA41FXS4_9EURY|nr:hypothetical protein [Haloarcula salina]MBV0900752.1 hypothetical protein [Haloarcula salina]